MVIFFFETELEETFLIFDKTGDQELDVEEAGRMWRSTGLNPTKSEIQEMFNEIDLDGKLKIIKTIP